MENDAETTEVERAAGAGLGRLDLETAKTAFRQLLGEMPAFREFAARLAGKGKKRLREDDDDGEGEEPLPEARRARPASLSAQAGVPACGSGPPEASSSGESGALRKLSRHIRGRRVLREENQC